MTWVKESLRPVAARYLLARRRFSSSTLMGTSRNEVAVGTPRLDSMFSTILSATPRSGS
jgi:hypothetical protein